MSRPHHKGLKLELVTLLFHYIENNLFTLARKVILDGADLNKTLILKKTEDSEPFTPLKWAIRKKNIEMIELLLNHGASVLQTKNILNMTDIEFLDGILSELLIEELSKERINIKRALTLLRVGASLNYCENPLWALTNNTRLSESYKLMILEELLMCEDLNADTIVQLVSHPLWILSISKLLYQQICEETLVESVRSLLKYGAQAHLSVPFESPRMFLFDEEINLLETSFEKAQRLHRSDILEVMCSSGSSKRT